MYGNVRFSNGLHIKKDLEYDAYLSLMTRVVEEMEEEPSYVPGQTPVVFIGTPDNRNDNIPGFLDYWNVTGMIGSDVIYAPHTSRFQAYFDYVLNTPVLIEGMEVLGAQAAEEAITAMPAYPAEGCIAFYGDIMVVKLGEIE